MPSPSPPPATPLAPDVRRTLARLAQLGAWDPRDRRHPGREPLAGLALLERLRRAGYGAAIATTAPNHKSGRQLAPEYSVTISATDGSARGGRGAGSRLERAVWRAARALAGP